MGGAGENCGALYEVRTPCWTVGVFMVGDRVLLVVLAFSERYGEKFLQVVATGVLNATFLPVFVFSKRHI